ncbi:Coenzyme F420 hydrogenase/dehydrogenase, beta subunit C-terminal domain [Clostridium perfringens]|uniref:Coenzyme F420 hydrogenase/dehydrogenase, beta subunit C-terminal domain n=1 Tax=Clostridium perfringens TaxID=1502 RepID=UPI0013E3EE58|nr:Coenzyme F420 hydrogenase/dehydrogenase, beta subunit C-terminal domain [Clostridium perfringens]ELC8330623.1 Coenzyme F420 hydrogenase/dehydrogenase, beta subunit C-terminal domain [Clostridium perfringens]MDK0554233.1 Coenzyme F420 hydrogenase/dehydrogenase, beta subunit C-terminal domain [Clostridium perfringens]NGT02820.1 coenzyme F420 hydrogenase [Clostridium perfringens]
MEIVNNKNKIILFKNKQDCCGCSGCMNICPKQAISMNLDEYGFIYPKIDEYLCVKCGLCNKVCGFQNIEIKNTVQKAYASISKVDYILSKSASGGIFGTIAYEFISGGGVVYGSSMEFENNQLSPKHIRIDKICDIYKVQGSKYVQSDLDNCFIQIKNDLINNKEVLFSGTPCQVASLYSYLFNINIDKLYTIDIICHGVPSSTFFHDYIKFLSNKLKGTITNFKFRDKSNGWGLLACVEYINKNEKKKKKLINTQVSSYFKLFLESSTYRDSCYNCKYTNSNRPANITLGDYWGIQDLHPEYLKENGGELDSKKGISCVLVNNQQGQKMIDKYGENINLLDSTFEKVSSGNDQLRHPSKINPNRGIVLNLYKNGGYRCVEEWFNKSIGLNKYKIQIKTFIKINLKKVLKALR